MNFADKVRVKTRRTKRAVNNEVNQALEVGVATPPAFVDLKAVFPTNTGRVTDIQTLIGSQLIDEIN